MIEIKNGIAYQDDVPIVLHVVEIEPLENYQLRATFQNGEIKLYDFNKLLNRPAFKPLLDPAKFTKVKLDHGVPTWESENIDLSPESIFANGVTVGK